jgi:CheY-like chemotaxis protein
MLGAPTGRGVSRAARGFAGGSTIRHKRGPVRRNVGATIVLAEDESDLRAVYAECLRRSGHVVWEAADGGEAAAMVRAHNPDLLLLDLWMPVLNGLEVLEQIRGERGAVGLKVVVLTHSRDADTRLEGFALGASAYWTKDLSLGELSSKIETMLGAPPAPGGPDQPIG